MSLFNLQSQIYFTLYPLFRLFPTGLWQNFFSSEYFLTVQFLCLQVNHYAGAFYEYYYDYEKALLCYERATSDGKLNFPAEMDYINLKMKISPKGSYSPEFHLDKLTSDYSNPNYRVQILCHRGFYLYK
jgi:hypothetical protein